MLASHGVDDALEIFKSKQAKVLEGKTVSNETTATLILAGVVEDLRQTLEDALGEIKEELTNMKGSWRSRGTTP